MKNNTADYSSIAIIGASTGQLPLVRKAKEKGIHTICFAWEKGAVCKEECDEFYPISIFDTEKIVEKCRELKVDGVATTASEETAYVASIVSSQLGLNGNYPDKIRQIQDKKTVRELTKGIDGLSKPKVWTIAKKEDISYPCVVKPTQGSAKKGVCFCKDADSLAMALDYAGTISPDIMIEEYIDGDEYSVECLSYHGEHEIIQITRKVTSGYPHFVELEHHQPALIDETLKNKIISVIKQILSNVRYKNGASHIEIKVNADKIYLIEVNPRGGGDRISDTLIGLSTDCDYLSSMIDIALGKYEYRHVNNIAHCGILFLSAQNSRILKYFNENEYDWMIERERTNLQLTVSSSNYDRDGYIIYRSQKPLDL